LVGQPNGPYTARQFSLAAVKTVWQFIAIQTANCIQPDGATPANAIYRLLSML
jgi:hypothetical protein